MTSTCLPGSCATRRRRSRTGTCRRWSRPRWLAPDASTEVMRWQADTGEPGSMVGGYFLGPGPNGQATFGMGGPQQYAAQYLNRLWSGRTHQTRLALVRSAPAYWQPAAVVAVTPESSVLGHFLISLLGPPTFTAGRLLVWRR